MRPIMKKKSTPLTYRLLSAFIAFTFSFTSVIPPSYAQSIASLNLPVPGTMVTPSAAFVPVLLKGMTIHPDNPLQFDFIIDSGNTNFKEDEIKAESERLVKYFLASMTIPKDDLWVNLSPYESDKIVPDELGKTELGRDMLAQDYILKQLTASLMYPEKELGKEFWNKVYKLAQEKYGITEIPVNTFNKVWILPETATVYEHGQTVYIVEAKLRVMLDSDYLAQSHQVTKSQGHQKAVTGDVVTGDPVTTQIVREVILPAIEREVNEGQNFAPLRQIYHSLILAKWYKETIKNSLLSKVYVDKKLINGIRLEDGQLKGEDGSIIDSQSSIVDQIYNQYMEAYKKGVFNYIKEDYDQLSTESIPRKYFSGGIKGDVAINRTGNQGGIERLVVGKNYQLALEVTPQKQGASSPIFEDFFKKRKVKKIIKEKLKKSIEEKYANHGNVYLITRENVLDAIKYLDEGYDFEVDILTITQRIGPSVTGSYYDDIDGGMVTVWSDGTESIDFHYQVGSEEEETEEIIKINRGKKLGQSSSPITPQQAEVMIKAKLTKKYPDHPEYADLITNDHAWQVIEAGGQFDVEFFDGDEEYLVPLDVAGAPSEDQPGFISEEKYITMVHTGDPSAGLYDPTYIESRFNPDLKHIKIVSLKKSSSPIAPQEAEAMIKGKLAPEHHHLINDTHVQLAMAYEGNFDVVYYAGPPERIEIVRGETPGRSSSPAVDSGQKSTSDEIRDTNDDKLGGIDMNAIDLDREGAGVDIQFDPAELQEMIDAGIDGFAPVIINITPLAQRASSVGTRTGEERNGTYRFQFELVTPSPL